jgi:deazaflavin-dependent oxidoreductase (nitroreductase family)
VPVPPVDPDQALRVPRWLARPYQAFARSRLGRWVGVTVLVRVDPHLLRWSRGRVSLFGIYPHVELTVPGRTSGLPRTVPLLYFTHGHELHGEEVILVASSFGRDAHPAWYGNVLAHPEVTLTARGTSWHYVARELAGAERDARFADAVRMYAGYGDYAARTAAVGRTIPVLALRGA